MEFVAVEGLTIDHKSGSLCSGGSFVITNVASTKDKVNGNGVYKTSIVFTFSGGTYSGGVSGSATGAGTILATATKVKVENGYVMRLNDEGTLTGTYTLNGSPPVPGTPFSSTVLISDANQDKVKAN